MKLETTKHLGVGATYTFFKNGVEVGKTKNLLTNGFWSRHFDFNGNKETGNRCYIFVGTGTTPPTKTDTGMESNVGTSAELLSLTGGSTGVLNGEDFFTSGGRYYGVYSWAYTFPVGTFSGQAISEVGARFCDTVSANKANPNVIDSHALILDATGAVAPITLSSADQLTVQTVFQFEILNGFPMTATIQGNPYKVYITAGETWDGVASEGGRYMNSFFYRATNSSTVTWFNLFQGQTFPISQNRYGQNQTGVQSVPTPQTSAPAFSASAPYSNNQLVARTSSSTDRTLTITYSLGVTQAQLTTGIGRIWWGWSNNSSYIDKVLTFDPPLTGTGTNVLGITIRYVFGDIAGINEETPLTLFASPATLIETVANGASTTVQQATCITQGGKLPLSYSWAYVSGGSALLSADSSTSRTTTFTGTGTSQTSNEVWRCTVTDSSLTPQVVTQDFNINITWA